MRKVTLAIGEYYHVFNRGVDKRSIFLDQLDIQRFLESVREFNVPDPIGSLFEHRFRLGIPTPKESLADVVCFCLNPNHYHLLLRQNEENGIQKLMQKIGTGYVNYFNEKYERSGALFQGRYKAVHVASNTQLLHTSVYINLNDKIGVKPILSYSSWEEYIGHIKKSMCKKEIILGQFADGREYENFARSSLEDIMERKRAEKDLQ
jgi:putative transposase